MVYTYLLLESRAIHTRLHQRRLCVVGLHNIYASKKLLSMPIFAATLLDNIYVNLVTITGIVTPLD